MHLVIESYGARLSVRQGRFRLETKDGERVKHLSPDHVSHISLTNVCSLTTKAIELAIQNDIPILLVDKFGTPMGMFWSDYPGSIASIRRGQLLFSQSHLATAWIIKQFEIKTARQIENLAYLAQCIPSAAEAVSKACAYMEKQLLGFQKFKYQVITPNLRLSIMGTEGTISAAYFQCLGEHLPEKYRFMVRSRRPALDIFNSALNYLYGMLYNLIKAAVFHAGLDPYFPILHRDAYYKMGFVFDFIEAYRPFADKILIEMCVKGDLLVDYFIRIEENEGFYLKKEGKTHIIPAWDTYFRYHVFFEDRMISRKEKIQKETVAFAQEILQNHITPDLC